MVEFSDNEVSAAYNDHDFFGFLVEDFDVFADAFDAVGLFDTIVVVISKFSGIQCSENIDWSMMDNP